jgi:hypothetical protein
MFARSVNRVEAQSPEGANDQIRLEMEQRLAYYREHPDQIDQRLRQLDEEWDIERTIQVNASTLILSGLTLGLLGSRKYLLLSGAVAGFLLQHGIQGWCPPVYIFRKLGIRTVREIEEERDHLQQLQQSGLSSDTQASRRFIGQSSGGATVGADEPAGMV